MIYRDPKCVHVADSLSEAESVVHFLKGQGLAAEVMNPATLGGLLGLTWLSRTGVSANGLEVWVNDAADAPQALARLKEFAAEQTRKAEEKDAQGPVAADCEECDRTSTFPAAQRGTTQDCPHCGAYLDVPD